MTKQVKCISPHGGCHNGMRHDGSPVFALPNGDLPQVDPEKLRLPPHEGGYIRNVQLGHCAVGEVYDAPDDFIADGFHFEDVKTDSGEDKAQGKVAVDSESSQVSGTPQPDSNMDGGTPGEEA